jgi:hypothetical protein
MRGGWTSAPRQVAAGAGGGGEGRDSCRGVKHRRKPLANLSRSTAVLREIRLRVSQTRSLRERGGMRGRRALEYGNKSAVIALPAAKCSRVLARGSEGREGKCESR